MKIKEIKDLKIQQMAVADAARYYGPCIMDLKSILNLDLAEFSANKTLSVDRQILYRTYSKGLHTSYTDKGLFYKIKPYNLLDTLNWPFTIFVFFRRDKIYELLQPSITDSPCFLDEYGNRNCYGKQNPNFFVLATNEEVYTEISKKQIEAQSAKYIKHIEASTGKEMTFPNGVVFQGNYEQDSTKKNPSPTKMYSRTEVIGLMLLAQIKHNDSIETMLGDFDEYKAKKEANNGKNL